MEQRFFLPPEAGERYRDIHLAILEGNAEYTLTKPAYFWFTMDDAVLTVRIPEGFSTDLASLPAIASAFAITNADPRLVAPAILHDFLYRTGGVLARENGTNLVAMRLSRKEKDAVFLQKMLDFGFPRWRAYLVYIAVRLFGWLA